MNRRELLKQTIVAPLLVAATPQTVEGMNASFEVAKQSTVTLGHGVKQIHRLVAYKNFPEDMMIPGPLDKVIATLDNIEKKWWVGCPVEDHPRFLHYDDEGRAVLSVEEGDPEIEPGGYRPNDIPGADPTTMIYKLAREKPKCQDEE